MNKTHSFMIRFVFLMFFLLLTGAVFAWSNPGTYQLTRGQSPTTYTTESLELRDTKTTSSTTFRVDTYTKTMWSYPEYRLVNSNYSPRSDWVAVPAVGGRSTGTGNSGVIGYYYYGQIKPAWNQLGTDTIRLDFSAD